MTIWILMALLPFVLGMGILCIINLCQGKKTQFRYYFTDAWLTGGLIAMLVGEVCHILGAYGGMALTDLQKIFWLGMTVACVLALIPIGLAFAKKLFFTQLQVKRGDRSFFAVIWFLALLTFEIVFIFCTEPVKVPGDIMTETIRSFLSTDAVYSVNPLTGRAYAVGISGRIKLLELPTLYAILVKTFGMDVASLIRHTIPIVVLMASVMAYYRLSRFLFGERGKWNYLFLFFVLAVFLFGDGAKFLPGYQILHSGYLGEGIRNNVLFPLVLSALLEIAALQDLRKEKEQKDLLFAQDGNKALQMSEKEKEKARKLKEVKEKENRMFRAEIRKRTVFPVILLVGCVVTEGSVTPTFYGVGMCLVCIAAAVAVWLGSEFVSCRLMKKGQEETK